MSVGPPIIRRCSTLSRRTSTRRRRPSTAAASITASRGIRPRWVFAPSRLVANRRTSHAATPINARTTMNATMKVIGLPCILVPDKWRLSRARGQMRQPPAYVTPNCDFLTSHGKFCRPQLLITHESLDPKRLLGLCIHRQAVGLMPLLEARDQRERMAPSERQSAQIILIGSLNQLLTIQAANSA